tara:strand:+ start:695 stop:856 length:162 start_codon:yes stop_codon:yes gene_type:complete
MVLLLVSSSFLFQTIFSLCNTIENENSGVIAQISGKNFAEIEKYYRELTWDNE